MTMMRIGKRLLQKYNKHDHLMVISSYPKKGEIYSGNVGGIASFAKNTVRYLPKKTIVIAEYFGKPEVYEEGNTLVIRAFRKNKVGMWLTIFRVMRKFGMVKRVLVEFDFALYGDMVASSLILPFLAVLRAAGYKVNIVVHSVIHNVFNLSGHLGLSKGFVGKVKGWVLNKIFHGFYASLSLVAERVITTDEVLKRKISRYIKPSKVVAIPHGVDRQLKLVSKQAARRKLGIDADEEVVLFFGFVNWFKGSDIFVSSFRKARTLLGKRARFIIAGGESATLKQKDHYKKYFEKIEAEVNGAGRMELTGFVPQEKLGLYFSAADIVVLPHRAFIGASGVFSLVSSYKKPFVLSSSLSPLLRSDDFVQALEKCALTKKDLVFGLNGVSCKKTVVNVLKNGIKTKMMDLSEEIGKQRDWKKMALMYDQAIFGEGEKV